MHMLTFIVQMFNVSLVLCFPSSFFLQTKINVVKRIGETERFISYHDFRNFERKLYYNFNPYNNNNNNNNNVYWPTKKNGYYEDYIRKLNSKNTTIQNNAILSSSNNNYNNQNNSNENSNLFELKKTKRGKVILVINPNYGDDLYSENGPLEDDYDFDESFENEAEENGENQGNKGDYEDPNNYYKQFQDYWDSNTNKLQPQPRPPPTPQERRNERYKQLVTKYNGNNEEVKKDKNKKSENFEVITNSPITFKDIGGYENIKLELSQCIDILTNYKKYKNFNVRIPKGIILEGPPGNGKTLLAKGFAGETKVSFIPVSGSQFQEKYVGVGSKRVRELFELAKKNIPCIIFIDEIDAIGRSRSSDGESSSSERDSTLNELLVQLDGFNPTSGIFLMGATNRVDLLDNALTRPGRIDKKIFIGPPDKVTRESILKIHLKGKPHDKSINIKDLVDMTSGMSGAQIENLLNEAMLNALRFNRFVMDQKDLETVITKIMVGWQPTEHQFTNDIIDRIAIHEMGHAIVGFLSKHHSHLSKVVINLSAPNSPGYTLFEPGTNSNIYIRESLFEHLMILLAGRIAEEAFYDVSITTGANNDFQEALKLAEKMILFYGMGTNVIYPSNSEKYKSMIDDEVYKLINNAYTMSDFLVKHSKPLIAECAEILKKDKILRVEQLNEIILNKYPEVLDLKINGNDKDYDENDHDGDENSGCE
jgi:cell division protease FtsH